MTDHELAAALVHATALEQRARQHWTASVADLPERDAAQNAVRHVTALRRSLESWMATRAVRASLVHTS